MKRRVFLGTGIGLLAAMLAGCQTATSTNPPAATPAAQTTRVAPAPTPAAQATQVAPTATVSAAMTGDPNLKIGTLPIVDVVPMFLAEKNGYFKELGLNVELVPFTSAVERDTAIQAGQIDGQLNDMVSTSLLNKTNEQVKIVRTALKTNPQRFIFSIVVPGNSPIQKPEDLRGKDIALSLNTVIEYWTDERMASLGFKEGDYGKVPIPTIPARLQALSSGQVAAANMPEPFASKAIKDGARLVVDDKGWDFGTTSVIVFTTNAISKKTEAVKRFLKAFDRAAKEINANPEQYRALLVEQARVSADIKDSFQMVPYPGPEVPTKAEVERLMKWAVAKKLVAEPLSYEKMVDPKLIG